MKSRFFAISALILCVILTGPHQSLASPAPKPPTIYTTLPWLTDITRFIVVSTLKVQPMSAWSEDGVLRTLRRPPAGAKIIALDPKDAGRYGFKTGDKNIHLLYENLPVSESKRNVLPFDPSVLPFLSQRLLVVLCELEPENYSFYQRRLAEFQSRLESTLEVGRSLIPDNTKLLDLTGSSGPWIRAAVSGAVRPPDDLWAAWSKGAKIPELTMALDEAKKRSWWIVLDAWTPAPIRSHVMGTYQNVYIQPGTGEQDFFTRLHDIYLELRNAIVRK